MEKAVLPTPAATWSTRKPSSSSERLRPARYAPVFFAARVEHKVVVLTAARQSAARSFVDRSIELRMSNFIRRSNFAHRVFRMSLISSIQLANSSLQATQVGLQVVGQNIANANTPGYVRETVDLQPGPTQRQGNLLFGSGVEVQGIVQQVDKFLQERLRNATSDSSGTQVTQQTYSQLEGLVGELGDTDLSTSLDNFFSSISDILNQPESDSVRNLAVLQGQSLTSDINDLATRSEQLRSDLNDRVGQSADDINGLLTQVAKLNTQIANAEGGGTSTSNAVGLARPAQQRPDATFATDRRENSRATRRHRFGLRRRRFPGARRHRTQRQSHTIEQIKD